MKGSPRIELSIGAVILDGVPPSPGIAGALEEELLRLFSAPGALAALAPLQHGPQQYQIGRIDAGSLLAQKASAARVGAQLGAAIYKNVHALGRVEPPAAARPGPHPQIQPKENRS